MSGPSSHEVLKDAAEMMSEYLLETEGLSNLTAEELMLRLELIRPVATGILGESFFMSDDGFAFCKALGFDMGLAVRRPDGSEFIFYPAKNFGPNSAQSDPKPAKAEVPKVSSPASDYVSALPFSVRNIPKMRPIGFMHTTHKADEAGPEKAFPGINEYEGLK